MYCDHLKGKEVQKGDDIHTGMADSDSFCYTVETDTTL